jgi:hypothetical protein
MASIQAVIHVYNGKTTIARTNWTGPDGSKGINTMAEAGVTTLSGSLPTPPSDNHVIAPNSPIDGTQAQNPLLVLFTVDGTDYAARGFVPFGGADDALGPVTLVVAGLSDAEFNTLWALTAGPNGNQGHLDGLPAASRSIAYGTPVNISDDGGSTAALDYADALDGDD